jgi:catechol 2,3-dioxygenase-like lactoylglutathione lyase family enzyme
MGLSDFRVMPAIAVSDMDGARAFYEGKLGLAPGEERPDGGVRYPCGGGSFLHVYPSPANAGKSPATLAGFEVDHIEGTVDGLIAAGVTFEQYDVDPIKTDEKGIARLGEGTASAWFKDPDGNVLAVIEE